MNNSMSRRTFAKTTMVAAAGTALVPSFLSSCARLPEPLKRPFGKTGFNVTTLGLGGQASIQWTPEGVDPVEIILKAFDLGINYFDTSNLYGPSQSNFGKAFALKNLIPGNPGYDENLRNSIFLTTKTHLRFAKGGRDLPGVTNWTDGEPGSHTIDDLKRSLTLMFGDGKGQYPQGSFVDMVLIHDLTTREEVDVLYEGIENTNPSAPDIGALAALRDYRDGTNLTGLNPGNEKLLKHMGFSGHWDPAAMMYMIRRDTYGLLDGMLVAINANDKLMFNMQYNVMPLATAKNMGIIAMKVFADGAMYSKPAEWSHKPEHVVRTVGSPELRSSDLVRYSLTIPGVHTAIIGIGQISNKEEECQLTSNFLAAQVLPGDMTEEERTSIEALASKVKSGRTNYFQIQYLPLAAPEKAWFEDTHQNDQITWKLNWTTAYAGDAPLKSYEIWRDGNKVYETPAAPQLTEEAFSWEETLPAGVTPVYTVKVWDEKGRMAERGIG